jgi:hypothetical protein
MFATAFEKEGFAIIPSVYTPAAVAAMIQHIEAADTSGPLFRKTGDLFAIRRFLDAVPGMESLLFTTALQNIIRTIAPAGSFIVKAIYFDKPGQSNWFVAYHQDLMITVNQKHEIPGYGPWTHKQDTCAVMPPTEILEQSFTLRIHLDDTTAANGALKVIPGSHHQGIYRPETIDWTREQEVCCEVPAGGVMLMRPLLLHASSRSTNQQQRRVIHIEFNSVALPQPLQWAERRDWN